MLGIVHKPTLAKLLPLDVMIAVQGIFKLLQMEHIIYCLEQVAEHLVITV